MNTITFEVVDNSALSISHAIIKYYKNLNASEKNHIIDLEELCDHIKAYVKAEKKAGAEQ